MALARFPRQRGTLKIGRQCVLPTCTTRWSAVQAAIATSARPGFTISRTTKWSTSFVRPPLVHAVLGVRSRGQGPRVTAKTVWRLPGNNSCSQPGVIETLVRGFRRLSGAAGRTRWAARSISTRRSCRCLNSATAVTTTWPDQGRRDTRGLGPNQPAKRSQKDTDARAGHKKHGKSHYGGKNHVNVDRRHKLVRRYQVTATRWRCTTARLWMTFSIRTTRPRRCRPADSAYRSAEIEAKLKEKGLKSRIHRKGYRNREGAERAGEAGQRPTRSKVAGAGRAPCSGRQSNDMGGTLVRSKRDGPGRARARIGLKNLADNHALAWCSTPTSRHGANVMAVRGKGVRLDLEDVAAGK